MKWSAILLCLAFARDACAVERQSVCASARHRAVVQLNAGLTVVPFAVPVAVPVAVVSQPAVFYARRVELVGDRAEGAAARLTRPAAPTPAPQTAEEVLRNRCAACHTGPSAKGELRLFEREGALVERLPRRAVLDAVVEGRMPKGVTNLTEEEIELLAEWAKPPRELVY